MTPDHFYTGLPGFGRSVDSVLGIFLFHDLNEPSAAKLYESVHRPLMWLIAAVLGFAVAVCVRLKRYRELGPVDRLLTLSTAALLGSVVLLLGAHFFLGVLYPIRRTGIYWIPLAVLICLSLFAKVPDSKWRPLPVVVGVACVIQFLLQWNVHHYSEWPYDFDTPRIVRQIREDHARIPSTTVRINASWSVQPGLNFYRRKYRLGWMELVNWTLPLKRAAPDFQVDYYLLQGPDRALVEEWNLEKVYENPSALLALATPRR
jgi:hypothetical protein